MGHEMSFEKMISGAYERRIRELGRELAERVRMGEMSELAANEMMVRKQEEWSESPWG